jgi:hypothetical protein
MPKTTFCCVFAAVILGCAISAAAPTGLNPVPLAPGAFEPLDGPAVVTVGGKPLQAAQVETLAGKADDFDLLLDGESRQKPSVPNLPGEGGLAVKCGDLNLSDQEQQPRRGFVTTQPERRIPCVVGWFR